MFFLFFIRFGGLLVELVLTNGWNPAPPGMYKTLQILGYLPYQLVFTPDFWTINRMINPPSRTQLSWFQTVPSWHSHRRCWHKAPVNRLGPGKFKWLWILERFSLTDTLTHWKGNTDGQQKQCPRDPGSPNVRWWLGGYNHLQNARYLGSMKPFLEGEPGSLGMVKLTGQLT